ncbi:Glyoxysomal processing protease glyoxysomal [Zea mays]|uniref:Glyoxysomal processing protease glyoxysomal n=1 Tax=Zea mays TaxID=4577 RepID=A0A1D6M7G9_MAIZE|nr:Glyoxysomal processing protease glyoxysomal [Zea mays]
MEAQEIAAAARHFCAMVRIVGPYELGNAQDGKSGPPRWLPARLLAMVKLTVTIYKVENDSRSSLESNRNNSSLESVDSLMLAKSATRIAILGISTSNLNDARRINVSVMQQRGDPLLIVGSPFGLMSPFHFFNSVSVGAVANCLPPCTARSSLLMADMHCLPGMEGAPVFDQNSCLVGLLMNPLTQKGSNIEVQLVITWDAICTEWNSKKLEEIERPPRKLPNDKNTDSKSMELRHVYNYVRVFSSTDNKTNQHCISPRSLREAISAVVLVTVGDTSWASGIVLNKRGLVLTNAHLLEPWRFGRTSPSDLQASFAGEHLNAGENKSLQPQQGKISNEDAVKHKVSSFNLGFKRGKRISVRLDHEERQIWCNASVVFISKGPLDVALLQIEKVPVELNTIRPEFVCPTAGSPVYVVGHGLFGPRSGLHSSLYSGVVSKVVQIPANQLSHLARAEADNMDIPVMLQTTAAVHPGASGGVLVNTHGLMVGIITSMYFPKSLSFFCLIFFITISSNAKHGGGSTIPHLNFSIPCKLLVAVFEYSANGNLVVLEQLDKPNEVLSSVWALAPSSSPFVRSSPEKGKEEKVLEFSKFLSDKQQALKSNVDLKELFRYKTPSKI